MPNAIFARDRITSTSAASRQVVVSRGPVPVAGLGGYSPLLPSASIRSLDVDFTCSQSSAQAAQRSRSQPESGRNSDSFILGRMPSGSIVVPGDMYTRCQSTRLHPPRAVTTYQQKTSPSRQNLRRLPSTSLVETREVERTGLLRCWMSKQQTAQGANQRPRELRRSRTNSLPSSRLPPLFRAMPQCTMRRWKLLPQNRHLPSPCNGDITPRATTQLASVVRRTAG